MEHTKPSAKYNLFDTVVFTIEDVAYKFEVTPNGLKPIAGDFEVFIEKMRCGRSIYADKINELMIKTNPDLAIIKEITDKLAELTTMKNVYASALAVLP